MIIETREDVVRLSGSLHKNQWMTIKAAANLLLQDHPEGIIIDCTHLEDISESGAKTFLEAMRDIESAHSRIIVACLPQNVYSICRKIPGVRSQLPIAETLEAARASLRSASKSHAPHPAAQGASGKRGPTILIPLLSGIDLSHGVELGARLALAEKGELELVYFIEVARTMPLNAPLPEEEEAAENQLAQAKQRATQANAACRERIERVREAVEGILASVKTHSAGIIVLGISEEPPVGEAADFFARLTEALLKRAPCEVVVGRRKLS